MIKFIISENVAVRQLLLGDGHHHQQYLAGHLLQLPVLKQQSIHLAHSVYSSLNISRHSNQMTTQLVPLSTKTPVVLATWTTRMALTAVLNLVEMSD